MGKLDGMDPKLVRDLLSEVRQAAERMRTTEGRVARMISSAGLSAQSTHRPSQVADACDVMVRDVSGRVELLEKRVKQEGGASAGQPVSSGDKAGDHRAETSGVADAKGEASKDGSKDAGAKEHEKPGTPKAEDLKPAVRPDDAPKDDQKPETKSDADAKPDAGSKGDERSPRDGQPSQTRPDPDTKPDAGSKGDERSPRDGDRPDSATKPDADSKGEHSSSDAKPDAGSKGDERSPRDGDRPDSSAKPDTGSKGGDSSSDAKPDAGSKGDERSPREDSSSDGGSKGGDSSSEAKPDAGSKGDERSPREDSSYGSSSDGGSKGGDSSDAKPDAGSKGDERSPRDDGKVDILDTPQKDHPDDVDQAGADKPKVVEVDGEKVLQIPLDSPTAEQVNTLLDHIEDVPLLDAADGNPDPGGTAQPSGDTGSGPQGGDANPGLHSGPDGADSHQAGKADPYEASPSAKPALPIPDTVEQALDPAPQNMGGQTSTQAVGAFYDGGSTNQTTQAAQTGTQATNAHATSANTHAAGTHATGTHASDSGGGQTSGTHSTNSHATGTHAAGTDSTGGQTSGSDTKGTHPTSSGGDHKTVINTAPAHHPVAHTADPKDGVLAQWAKEADTAGDTGKADGFYGDDWEEEEGTWRPANDGQGGSQGAVLREDPSRPSTPSGPGVVK
ncbi:hypothetical protein [Streptosporangium saharense]|uniref:Uncharacterized protein n=1 Tax=Streptosporangium saharense TaxID=1706840 RepID=A0A7W7QJ75_9ACTN|nr:hypothetical protein [Streptosporangium saharense]MBB4914537.1 hypothetical protein [Streptosporangium saharense]